MRVGLSLSFCMSDCLAGANVDDIDVVIACTRFESAFHAMDHYYSTYWNRYDKEVVWTMLKRMWPKVRQPRFDQERYVHNIAQGHYMTATEEEIAIFIESWGTLRP